LQRFGHLLDAAYELMKFRFDILGYSISLWSVFIFSMLAGTVLRLIYGFLE